MMLKKRILLAVTGASGAPIAVRLIETLLNQPLVDPSFIFSENARLTFKLEADIDFGQTQKRLETVFNQNFNIEQDCHIYDNQDMAAKVSSGSYLTGGMIIAPCSMSTLAAIANGITMNLIQRVASVMLKEKRPLLLVPRESPLSPIHLKNMLELSRIGVHIVPATLAFYTKPRNIQDMSDFVCARVLDLLGIPHELSKRWNGELHEHEGHTRIHRYME